MSAGTDCGPFAGALDYQPPSSSCSEIFKPNTSGRTATASGGTLKQQLLFQRHHHWQPDQSHATRHLLIHDGHGWLPVIRDGFLEVDHLLRAEQQLDHTTTPSLWDGPHQLPKHAVLQDIGFLGPYELRREPIQERQTGLSDRHIKDVLATLGLPSDDLPHHTPGIDACVGGHIPEHPTSTLPIAFFAICLHNQHWTLLTRGRGSQQAFTHWNSLRSTTTPDTSIPAPFTALIHQLATADEHDRIHLVSRTHYQQPDPHTCGTCALAHLVFSIGFATPSSIQHWHHHIRQQHPHTDGIFGTGPADTQQLAYEAQ